MLGAVHPVKDSPCPVERIDLDRQRIGGKTEAEGSEVTPGRSGIEFRGSILAPFNGARISFQISCVSPVPYSLSQTAPLSQHLFPGYTFELRLLFP